MLKDNDAEDGGKVEAQVQVVVVVVVEVTNQGRKNWQRDRDLRDIIIGSKYSGVVSGMENVGDGQDYD